MAWTKEQEKAIFLRGSNIIVSAGAGSGKTAVLSERILEYCKAGGDIRRILVLTFTKAAASEMKERIRKKLLNNKLYDQADYIDAAYITTFDSYSLSLVKKYYYRLGISHDVAIIDSMLINIKRHEIIRELFNELYEEENPEFLSLLDKYTTKSDKDFMHIIESLCEGLDLLIDINKFIKDYENNYLTDEHLDSFVNDYLAFSKDEYKNLINDLEILLDEASTDVSSAKLYDLALEYYNNMKNLDDYTDMYNSLQSFSLGKISSKADERVKEAKTNLSATLANLKKNVFNKYIFPIEMKEELIATRLDILAILRICHEVINRLFSYKLSINMFEFSDIARLAIRLVKECDDVRNELKEYYNEILVDEYQDTSDMQEAFLIEIENNNRYMVGDIKQSIYRFRNANPYIFKDKYDSYSLSNGGEKIDLTFNFRSRGEVLDNINLLFNKLMTDTLGDANYKKDHQMRYGQKNYELINQPIDFNIEVLKFNPDDYEGLDSAEKEAFIIGKSIKNIMNSGAKVLKGDKFVPVGFSDFAILIDKAKSFTTFKRVFEYLKLPLSIEADLDLKDSILPKLFTNILSLINGVREKTFDTAFKHSKVALARSFIYSYSDEDIYDMAVNHEKLGIDDDIYYLAKLTSISYSSLFFKICERLDIYNKLSLIGNVDNSLIILESIHNMLKTFSRANVSLGDACKYLNEAFSSDMKLPYTVSSGNRDSVRIMTIHKSKGLEFAYCYFPLLESAFNQADQRKSTGLDNKYGIYIPFAEEGKSNTIIKPLVASNINRLDISEKVRLLYVALTRAREKMFLIMEDKEYKNINPKKLKSFAEMIEYTGALEGFSKLIDLNDYDLNKDYKKGSIESLDIKATKSYSYNNIEPQIKIHKSHISKEMKAIPDLNSVYQMERGTFIHECLEVLNLKKPDIASLPVDDDIKAIVKDVLALDILSNISSANVLQEHEFYFNDGKDDYHGIIDLFLEYNDHIDIIDYKLANLDSPEYKRQLSIYKKYAASRSNKPVYCYLLSILHKEVKKVDV